ncbi:hypothetical protein NPIL_43291 [Nephila pilipes]|uniref:Uncharacterized protein n=1 Tax=Nephila pilipes TaxID=299642 RepID=A0A8X6P0X0_NEPPI|nr:hypothetical protein NPIL_43291 [Nephila pilipes]
MRFYSKTFSVTDERSHFYYTLKFSPTTKGKSRKMIFLQKNHSCIPAHLLRGRKDMQGTILDTGEQKIRSERLTKIPDEKKISSNERIKIKCKNAKHMSLGDDGVNEEFL